MSEDTFLEPDFVFYPRFVGLKGLNAETALLAVEVSDSSLGYDLGRKAGLYAAFGIRELWVIHAVRLETHIHRDPHPERYGYKKKFKPKDRLVPKLAPALAVTLAELDLV